ncbi:MAG TPA: O-antigen ligase family protein [Thermoanaerobaculaceae bacterium]|nr:O-antigen ligase family protein [Thermoanaerobaculaceae bacterium]
MRGVLARVLPAALVPVAAAWVLAPRGAALAPGVALATVAVVAALATHSAARGTVARSPVGWLAALVAWAALDAVIRPVAAVDAAAAVAVGAVATLLAFASAAPRTAAWARLALTVAGTVAAAWMVLERAWRGGRPAGPFDNPDLAATLALLALALAPFLPLGRGWRGLLATIAAVGIVASGSRGALVALAAVALAWTGFGRGPRRLRWAAAIVALAAAGGLAARLALDRDPLRFERVRIWGVAARTIAAELPLGSGPGGYADAALPHNFPRDKDFARFARIPSLAESDYLEGAATLGAPGAALMLGLAASVLRRLRRGDARGWGVAAAVAATSAFSSQLVVPAVAWSASLALASVLPRGRLRAPRPGWMWSVAAGLAVAIPSAAILAGVEAGIGASPDRLIAAAAAASRAKPNDDAALADAEALLARACAARPRDARTWRDLGEVRLDRARLRRDPELTEAAADAFARARRANRLDVWAAAGEGRALHLAGDRDGALAALAAAVALEPRFVGAWLELAQVRLERGELAAAAEALDRAEAARRSARAAAFVSDYEHGLAYADPRLLGRLRTALGRPG